jgi:hypothetical protein
MVTKGTRQEQRRHIMPEQEQPLTFAEMQEILRRWMLENEQRRINDERRRVEEEKRRAEADAKWEKNRLAVERQMKETSRKISALGSRVGAIIEHMVSGKGKIVHRFRDLGYQITQYGQNISFVNNKLEIEGEIDLFLEDGDVAILIEVKTTLETADVKKHIERLEKYRRYADAKGDQRRFVGAVAGAVAADEVLKFAQENGMYTIVPSGKVFGITVPEGFKPKEW